MLYDPDNKVEFTDIIEVNTLELKKLPETEDGTELWNRLKFLSAERKEDLDMIAEWDIQGRERLAEKKCNVECCEKSVGAGFVF